MAVSGDFYVAVDTAAPCQYSSTTWEASSSRILWGAADIIR